MTSLPQKIYPVVDTALWVDRLGGAGARFIQLRIKDRSPEDLLAEIRAAHAFAKKHGVCLVLNDYWQIAIARGLITCIWGRKIWIQRTLRLFVRRVSGLVSAPTAMKN